MLVVYREGLRNNTQLAISGKLSTPSATGEAIAHIKGRDGAIFDPDIILGIQQSGSCEGEHKGLQFHCTAMRNRRRVRHTPKKCNYERNIRPGAQYHCKMVVGMNEIMNACHPKQKSARNRRNRAQNVNIDLIFYCSYLADPGHK